MKNRLRPLQSYLKNRSIELAVLISASNDPNYTYFTHSGAAGFLIVPANGQPFLITNKMEYERLKYESGFSDVVSGEGKRVSDVIKSRIKGIKRVGFNKDYLTVGMLHNLKKSLKARYVDISTCLNNLRSIKTPSEIRVIKEACAITDKLFKNLKGKTEMDIIQLIESRMRKLGLRPAFETIAAAGPNSSMPHHSPCSSKLKGPCIVDQGINYKWYNTDMSRTIFFSKPTAEQNAAFEAVRLAQSTIINLIKPGVLCKELAEAGDLVLKKYKQNILHSYGHGVGIAVHEPPTINNRSKERLQEGMVLAIEPGVYFKGRFGIRIEDMVVVTKKGSKLLTHAP